MNKPVKMYKERGHYFSALLRDDREPIGVMYFMDAVWGSYNVGAEPTRHPALTFVTWQYP